MTEALAHKNLKSVWRDEQGRVAGTALISEVRDHLVSLTWSLVPDRLDYITGRRGSTMLTLNEVPLGANVRCLLICPECSSGRSKLVLCGAQWGCRECHGLKYASQLEGRVAVPADNAADLRTQLRGGKPHGQWNSSRRAAVEACRKLDGQRPTTPHREGASHYVRQEWVGIDQKVEDLAEEDVILERDAFPYWEAYPRLEAVAARRALKGKRRLCLWAERTRIIGGAEVMEESLKLHVRYAVQRTACHHGAEGEATFEIAPTGSDDGNKRWLLRCPSCLAARSALALVHTAWACRACYGLSYRSALIGTPVRRAEKVASLERELELLRGSHRGRLKIKKIEAMLARAREAAGEEPYPVASRKYGYMVESVWKDGTYASDGFYDERRLAAATAVHQARPIESPAARGETPVTAPHRPHPLPLRPSDQLREARFGSKWLFTGESVGKGLSDRLRSLVNSVRARAAKEFPKPSNEVLIERLRKQWDPEPLKLRSRGGDEWLRFHNTSAHGETVPSADTHMLGSIHVGYSGSDEWWDVWPFGAEELQLKGSRSYSRLEMTVRVPVAKTSKIPALLHESFSLVREVLRLQSAEIDAFTEALPARAAKLLAVPRFEDDLEEVRRKLKDFRF